MHQAKPTLSRPVLIAPKPQLRFGLGKGSFNLPDDFEADNAAIEQLFAGMDDR